MAVHREIPIKVTAWVDEGVASLVAALNQFSHVMTLDSCQSSAESRAYVLFRCHEGDPSRFVTSLAAALAPHERDVEYVLRMEWRAGADEPLIELACPPDHVETLARLVNVCRTRVSSDGRKRRALRSSRARRSRQLT